MKKQSNIPETLEDLPETLKDLLKDENSIIPEIIDLNIDKASRDAQEDAQIMAHTLFESYCNGIELNSALTTQVKLETETLAILYQMRKWDNNVAKELMNGIQQAPTNASLYRALSEIQRTIIALTEKIDDTKQKLTNLLKNYQLESNIGTDITSKNIFRGNKEYIKAMENI